MRNRNIERAVKLALLAAGTVAGTTYLPSAKAQETPTEAGELEQVVVTGSRIPQPNLEGTSPVSLITSQDVALQGTQQVEDLVNNMPQVFAAQGGNYSNGATGTAQVNLRGLGPARTMVLVNGRRMVAGSPLVGGESPDLNQIPAPLIERVEVLTGGASAVYGSDAVAGVVNFIMKDNFEGIQFDGNYSFYNHNNSSDIADVVDYWGFEPSPKHIGADGDSYELSMLMGSNFADDRGNATFFVGYRQTDALLQSERDYSACTLGAHPDYYDGGFYCGGSGTSYPGLFLTDIGDGQWTVADDAGNVREWNDLYNFGPLNYWQRPDERWSASAFMHYNISDAATVYGEFMFMDDRTKSQIAPSGMFGVSATVPCDGSNPLVTQAWLDVICEPGADTGDVIVLRRNVEGGGRQDDLRHTSYRGVVGIKGDVLEHWNYDVSATYSQVVMNRTYQNDFSITRSERALNVVTDPDTGAPVCQSVLDGTDPTCVPYNLWSLNQITPEALDYLQIPLFAKGNTELRTVTATMAANLGDYGWTLPTANDGIGVAFGAQYYETGLDLQVDPNFESGDGAGQGGPTIGQTGDYNAIEYFGEIRVPLLQDLPFADSLLLNASYRRSEYSEPIDEGTDTYGVGLEWAPIESLKFRGSYQRAVRAPSIIELFQAQGVQLYDNDQDPCAGDVPTATLEQCAFTGVTAAQYGNIVDSPAGQYNALAGGSLELTPETADSYTIGLVFQPSFVEGLSLTVDYFNISVEDVILTIPPTITLAQCLDTGNPVFCSKIQRDAEGTLWLLPEGRIEALNENIGGLDTTGYDLEVAYTTPIGNLGSLAFRLNGTYLDELITTPIAGSGSIGEYDCAGLFGPTCTTPNPEWRHTARVTWQTPWNLDLSLGWRHFDKVELDATVQDNPLLAGNPAPVDRQLDAQDYLDIAGSWTFGESFTVRLGVNNVLDEDPPVSSQVGSGAGNGNTYPQVYDALGRYVFFGVTAKY